jgi:hypothetical protein
MGPDPPHALTMGQTSASQYGFPSFSESAFLSTNLQPTASLTPRLHRLYKKRARYPFPFIEDLTATSCRPHLHILSSRP